MNPTTQSRSPYWDIVKGIGIIAIVLGHSCYFAVGLSISSIWRCFSSSPATCTAKRNTGMLPLPFSATALPEPWPRYVFYTSCFVLLHNFFVSRGLYQNQELYNHTKMLAQICTNISFTGSEPAQGALWFVPAWLAASRPVRRYRLVRPYRFKTNRKAGTQGMADWLCLCRRRRRRSIPEHEKGGNCL